ncbi:hypothetical protein [Fluviicola taffensis]|uniref:hypothetical protein n=1 Tax=Fluviicola taffensis TaxID=191579 RepID=UPI0031376F8A
MKRGKLYLWILILFLLSIPAGFLTILTEQPYTPKSEYLLILIVGTFGVTIFVGSLSLIPYFVLKRNHSDYALKRALQCYTFFALALIAVATFKYPEAMKKRDRFHFSLYYEPIFKKIITKSIEAGEEVLPASIMKNREAFCFCIINKMEYNDQIIEQLRMGKDPEDLYYTDPEVKKIKHDCVDLYK